jgi:ppGpp synthetase/RelA/SpoT-type nucleotidyltranferase
MPNLVKPQDVSAENLAEIDFRFDIKVHHSTSRVKTTTSMDQKIKKQISLRGIDLADSTYELVVAAIREDANV